MKKVAIVSCYFQKNYGSILQSFATQKIVTKLGYENETICIDGIWDGMKKSKLKHYFSLLGNKQVVKGKLGYVKHYLTRKFNKELAHNISLRNKKLTGFSQTKFNVSKRINSREELTEYCNDCSSVIVGSDQLWLPSNVVTDIYTLTFVPDNINKISYATSFGVSDVPKKFVDTYKKFLSRIEHISVREFAGQTIVKNLIDRDIPVVCDPTLLFNADEWAEDFPSKRLVDDKYIFCYLLGDNPDQRAFVKKVKEKTGCKIVALLHLSEYIKSDNDFADEALYEVGPEEFVNLIRHAEYVFTDSFHCTVFSVLNSKNFFTFKRYSEGSVLNTNSRLNSLFKIINTPERYVSTSMGVDDMLNMKIDYNDIHARLAEMRKMSIAYLDAALKDGTV